ITLVLAVPPAFSLARVRVLDNFDFASGVQVKRTEIIPIAVKTRSRSRPAKAQTTANSKPLIQKTVQTQRVPPTRMGVGEGLAEREATPAEYNKLTMAAGPGGNASVNERAYSQLKGFTTGDAAIDSYIVDSSRRYAIDPLLIYSQMSQESSFKLRATSYKGASGLMQLMPATARRLGVENIYDPKQNIEGGVKYMRMLLDMFGNDVNLALAGYNAGEGAVMKYGNQIPPYNETQEYVRRISSRYASISDGTYARTVRRVNNTTAAK